MNVQLRILVVDLINEMVSLLISEKCEDFSISSESGLKKFGHGKNITKRIKLVINRSEDVGQPGVEISNYVMY
jgi:hypothetical protein